jgi:hypothetical protein
VTAEEERVLLEQMGSYSVPLAEADGNRTRLPAFAGTPVLKACPALPLPSDL